MMNFCSKHDCFQICPECMREMQQAPKPLADETRAATSRGARSTEDAGSPRLFQGKTAVLNNEGKSK